MSKFLVNPSIPLWHSIPGGLQMGTTVEIRGKVPFGANVFEINFSTGRDVAGKVHDKIFHMSVRFTGRVVVRNAHLFASWGNEEREGRFPFTSGQSFLMLILVEPSGYKVAVDGQHCYEFQHRHDVSSARFLYIDGSIKVEEVQYYSQPGTCVTPPAIFPNQTFYNPPIPFTYPITGGVRPGMNFFIHGRPSASVRRFTINLQCGNGPYPPPDIAFHFDVRHFSSIVVRNSRTDGRWGREEDQLAFFPFQPAVNFDLIIRVEPDKFVVTVNSQFFTEFRHRILPLARINTLSIEEDVVISSLQVQ